MVNYKKESQAKIGL
ncbi:Hypothetical protein EIN_386230, partial [Entamoeba invadens IP1]